MNIHLFGRLAIAAGGEIEHEPSGFDAVTSLYRESCPGMTERSPHATAGDAPHSQA